MSKLKDVTPGTVFGQLTVLGCCISNKKNYALCKCTCGTVKKVLAYSLGRSTNHNCGCTSPDGLMHRVFPTELRKEDTRLGRTYRAWAAMWAKANAAKKLADGIAMPPESWKDFSNFKQDLGFCPPDRVLDRIDVRLPYSAGNCTWSTLRDTWMNKESTVYYYNGKDVVYEKHLSEIFGYADNVLKTWRLKGKPYPGWKILTYDEVVAIRRANR